MFVSSYRWPFIFCECVIFLRGTNLQVFSSLELFLFEKVSGVCLYVTNCSHFRLLYNHWIPSQQTYITTNCSSRGLEVFKYSRKLHLALIGRNIFDFSRTTAREVTKLVRNVSLCVLKKCCYYSEQFEFQHGCHSLLFVKTFFTIFPKRLHVYPGQLRLVYDLLMLN